MRVVTMSESIKERLSTAVQNYDSIVGERVLAKAGQGRLIEKKIIITEGMSLESALSALSKKNTSGEALSIKKHRASFYKNNVQLWEDLGQVKIGDDAELKDLVGKFEERMKTARSLIADIDTLSKASVGELLIEN